MHVEFQPTSNCASDDLSNLETVITEKFNAIAKVIGPSEVDETVHRIKNIFSEAIKIIESKQKQSIVLFLWCRDDEAATKLLVMFESRQLERKLEEICSCLIISLDLPTVIIRVSMEPEFLLCLKRAAHLLNSDTTPSLKYEGLLDRHNSGIL